MRPRDPEQLLPYLAKAMPWRTHAIRLAKGYLDMLDEGTAQAIREAAGIVVVRECADRLNMPAELLVIALLARAASSHNRFAARVARAILGKAASRDVIIVEELLGLSLQKVAHS